MAGGIATALGAGAAGGGVLAGIARVDIRPDLSGFGAKLGRELRGVMRSAGALASGEFDKSLRGLGQSATSLGGLLTKGLTVPIAGAGAVAFKFGSDFESVLLRMVNLAGVGANEIDGIRDALLNLSRETGRGPQELAEALYEIRSSGLAGQQALDALETSAKAAALGLGDTQVVADALTSAVNAYGASGLTAAQAGDILAASVREGKGSADELAAAIGRVIPISAQMGVGFDDVGAALSTMTLSGLDADEAVTALRGIFGTLLNPASEANDVLASMGLNAQALRDQLRGQGLLSVLRTLAESMGGNEEAIGGLIGNVRALTGFLNLTGQDAEKVNGIFQRLDETVGTIDEGFERLQDDPKFKAQQALADVQAALVELGESVAPVAEEVLGGLSSISRGISDLPDGARTGVVAVGGLLAALGPLTFIGGKIASSVGLATRAVKGGATAFSSFRLGLKGIETGFGGATSNKVGAFTRSLGPAGLAGAIGGVGVVLGVGALALEEWQRKKEKAKQRTIEFTEALRADSGVIGENTTALIRNHLTQAGLTDDLAKLNGHLSSGRNAFDVLTDAANGNVDSQKELTEAYKAAFAAGELSWKDPRLLLYFEDLFGSADKARGALNDLAGATRTSADVDRALAAARQKVLDLGASGTASTEDLARAQADVTALEAERARIDGLLAGKIDSVTSANKRQVTTIEQAIDRNRFLMNLDAQRTGAVADVADAERELEDARADAATGGEAAAQAARREEDALRDVARATESAAEAQDKLLDARKELHDFETGTEARIRDLERQQIVDRVVTTDDDARQKEIDLLKFDQNTAEERERLQEGIAEAEDGVRDAAQRVADAQRTVADAARERQQVQVDAAKRVEDAERNLNSAIDGVVQNIRELGTEGAGLLTPWIETLKEIERLLAPGSPARANLAALIGDLSKLVPPPPPNWRDAITAGGQSTGELFGGFAMGGNVRDGWFVTGERGPELGYKSGPNVEIFSNRQSQRMAAGTSSGRRVELKQTNHFHGLTPDQALDVANRKAAMRLSMAGVN